MCFFISVYLLIGISEKYQSILFLLLKWRKILDFHRCGIPSYFSFPKQSFIAPHTVNSKVYFKNIEFNYLIRGVIQDFLSTFSVHHLYSLDHHFCLLESHFLSLEYHSLPFGCHFHFFWFILSYLLPFISACIIYLRNGINVVVRGGRPDTPICNSTIYRSGMLKPIATQLCDVISTKVGLHSTTLKWSLLLRLGWTPMKQVG